LLPALCAALAGACALTAHVQAGFA